ncbi:unnamed protein product [marine sediment metagenome]|uniref:Uncharacterized protein n=1 Tax=marine sediment metagenome TaxID=412755 RepID=X1QQ10_9ZZZZ
MSAEDYDTGWFRITEPLDGVVTARQEAAIRAYAREEGFETLRGYHMRLRMLGWDYYDVLRVVSP